MSTVCEAGAARMEAAHDFVVTTAGVVNDEAYWEYTLTHQWSSCHTKDEAFGGFGKMLVFLIQQQASSDTPWLICDNCGPSFSFDLEKARKFNKPGCVRPDSGPAKGADAAVAAAFVWARLYGKWP